MPREQQHGPRHDNEESFQLAHALRSSIRELAEKERKALERRNYKRASTLSDIAHNQRDHFKEALQQGWVHFIEHTCREHDVKGVSTYRQRNDAVVVEFCSGIDRECLVDLELSGCEVSSIRPSTFDSAQIVVEHQSGTNRPYRDTQRSVRAHINDAKGVRVPNTANQ